MGLGLTVVYAIVKRHEGHISMRSDPTIGTVVEVHLPASETKPDQTTMYSQSEGLSGGGKVLFMEDDEMVRDIEGKLLNYLGYEVRLANDGAEAIKLFREAKDDRRPFDLVILDLTVRAGMGGKEAIRALLQVDPSVKAIATSGYFDNPVMANVAEYGFRGALAKPFQIEEVRAVLQRVALEESA